MANVKKLTPQYLYKLVKEEKEKYEKDVKAAAAKTKEVDASEYADTLEKEIDFLAALKIKEGKLSSDLAKLREQGEKVQKKILASKRVAKK